MADSLQEYRRKQQERWRQKNNLPPLAPEVIEIPSSPVQQQAQKSKHDHILSDEEMAKKLQQEFDEEDQLLRQEAQQARALQQAQAAQQQQAQLQAQQAQQQAQQQRRRVHPQTPQQQPHPIPAHIARQHARLTRNRPSPFFNPQATHEQLLRNMFPSSPHSLPPFMSPTLHHPSFLAMQQHHAMLQNQMDFEDDEDEQLFQHHQIAPHMMPFFGGDGNMSYEQLQQLSDMMGSVNKGASTEQIDNTSVKFTIKDVTKEIPKDQPDCSICLCAFENGETARRLHCFHVYHADCVEKWLKTNSTCPVCKTDIKQEKK